MIRRHSRRVLIFLVVLFCAAIVTMLFIGRQQPPSAWSKILHLNDCELPCWVGIKPNETTLAEAKRKIKEIYSDTSIYSLEEEDYSFRVIYKPNMSNFAIGFRTNDLTEGLQSIIQEIYIVPNQLRNKDIKRPTMPDLYNDLGNPETIRLITGVEKERIVLLHKSQSTLVFLDDLECDKVILNQEISQIILTDTRIAHFSWLSDPQLWQGFGRCYHFAR